MRSYRQETIDIAVKHTGVSAAVAAESYDDTMPILSSDRRFSAKALDVLATSFVDIKALPAKPDMTTFLFHSRIAKGMMIPRANAYVQLDQVQPPRCMETVNMLIRMMNTETEANGIDSQEEFPLLES